MLRPTLPGIIEEGAEAVMGGRKARRFSILGSAGSFSEYVHGRLTDNDVHLPYSLNETMRIRLVAS